MAQEKRLNRANSVPSGALHEPISHKLVSGIARTTAEQVTLLTDEALAQGIQQGNRDDLAALIERHHGPLTGYLYRLTDGNLPLSQGLTQETFVRLIRNIGQYTYPRRFKPWLYAIATNLARDHYKRSEQRLTEALDEAQYDQSSESGSPEGVLLS